MPSGPNAWDVDPSLLLTIAFASVAGAGMGLFSGLVPGIHVNTLASLMLASYPALESAAAGLIPAEAVPEAVCCCIMAASVVHSFVDIVPSVFIGAPDSSNAVSVLPGHRLFLDGRGMAAVRASAIGSLVGCSAALLLAVPFQWMLLNGLEDVMGKLTWIVLLSASCVIVGGEFARGRGIWGLAAFLISGAFGHMCMTLPIPCDGILGEGTLLFPMLTGLFGLPVLLTTRKGATARAQTDGEGDPAGFRPGLRGILMGCVAGWFPGITSTVAASMSACVFPERRPEGFLSTVASIGTVTSVFSLVTLSVSGGGRSGTSMVIGDILGDSVRGFMSEGFMLLLLSCAFASVLGYGLAIGSGKAMARMCGGVDQRRLAAAVAVLTVALVLLLTGPSGIVILVFAAVLGFMPDAFGTSRTVLCGCLMVPSVLFQL